MAHRPICASSGTGLDADAAFRALVAASSAFATPRAWPAGLPFPALWPVSLPELPAKEDIVATDGYDSRQWHGVLRGPKVWQAARHRDVSREFISF